MVLKELSTHKVLKNAKNSSLRRLAKGSRICSVKQGEHIFYDKDDVKNVYFIIKGNITMYKLNTFGEKKVVFVLGRGSILNESITSDYTFSISAEAFSPSKIIVIPKVLLLQVMEEDWDLTLAIFHEMEHKVRRLYRQLKNTTGSLRMDKRLASKLWKLSKDYGIDQQDGVLINLNVSNTYLADLLGTKRETISRQMRILLEEGLILQDERGIIVPSRDQLREYFKKS
ncbi:MAG: Crp/Fnr family transcriptional regulator [Tissierellia bacterium]|nr:Crp/Fnr family transcriptional regulator [Tissierellia bacterium]